MSKIFRRGKGDQGVTANADDDMTIASAFSMGGSSVSDRIIGRMKKNLSSFGGSSSSRNLSSSSGASVNSTGGRMGFGSSRRSQSSRSFAGLSSLRNNHGNNNDNARAPKRSSSVSRMRKAAIADPSSVVFGGMGGHMDMREQSMLMGAKRRHPSAPPARPLASISNEMLIPYNDQHSTNTDPDIEPMEYSLKELRSMTESQLEQTMLQAGVPHEDIAKSLDEAIAMDASIDTVAADQKKNLLVALFVHSGHVKLVRGTKDHRQRRSMNSVITTDSDITDRRSTFTSSKSDMSLGMSTMSMNVNDSASVVSGKSTTSSKQQSRKSKLEKILELQTANSQVKRENKSLKKTVKKLLGQLLEIEEKDALAKKKEEEEGSRKSTMNSASGGDDAQSSKEPYALDKSERSSNLPPLIPETDSVNDNGDNDANNDNNTAAEKTNRSRRSSDFSMDGSRIESTNKSISILKRKIKKDRAQFQNTEFRLKVRPFFPFLFSKLGCHSQISPFFYF